jgi:hypothetical protein
VPLVSLNKLKGRHCTRMRLILNLLRSAQDREP